MRYADESERLEGRRELSGPTKCRSDTKQFCSSSRERSTLAGATRVARVWSIGGLSLARLKREALGRVDALCRGASTSRAI